MVNHYIATHPYDQPIGTVILTNTNNETVVSGLTYSSPVTRATHDAAVAIDLDLQTPTPTDDITTVTEATDLTSKRGGRPNGSTVGAINAQKLLVVDALDECAIEIASLKCTAVEKSHRLGNGKMCRVPKGAYEKAVAKVCEKYNVERIEISIETAISRTKVGRKLKVNHRGTDSAMINIEAHLLAVIVRRAALLQPVSYGEGLELAN
jgi:CO dehydrogenase nickel-insertion accessory protein CooC1